MLISIIFSITFTVNFVFLNNFAAPPGADYGNYLTQVDILSGNDLRGWGLRHQPVYFVGLDILTEVFDDFTALKVGAALVFSIIVIPFFMLAKKLSGSNIASAIATGIFTFFISNTEMISWGGNPNFLAFSFMILALYFIIDLINKPTKKSIVLAGFFLSLVIGTHILVTVFTFGILALFAVLSVIFMKNRKETVKGNIKSIFYLFLAVAAFSIPYVTFYLTYFRNSASEMAESHLFTLPYVEFSLSSFIGAWSTIVWYIAVVSIGATGIFWLSRYYIKEKKGNAILLGSLLIVPLALFLVTSQPLRWLYFLPIPFLLCFSIYSKNLFADVKLTKKATIKICAVLFMIIIAMESIDIGVSWLSQSTIYYQFIKKDEIEALNWIKSYTTPDSVFATSGHASDIGGGGNSYAWWVEGYANRICMFTGDLEFYSFQFERENVRTTNRIFAGTFIANYSNLEVSDSFPLGEDNPLISALIGDQYEELFTINDAQNQLLLSPAGDEQTMSIVAGYAETGIVNVTSSESKVTITVTYDQPDFVLTRSVIMSNDTTAVDVTYHITPKNSTLKEFKVNVWSLFETALEKCNIGQDAVATVTGQVESTEVAAEIKVVENSGELVGARVIFSSPADSKPVVNYIFEPLQNELYVHLKIAITAPAPESDPTQPDKNNEISLDSAYSQLESLSVDYIMVSKYRSEYFRFLYDENHFSVAFENGGIAIFKVISYAG